MTTTTNVWRQRAIAAFRKQATTSCGKAFTFTEFLEQRNFETHSCGNGRFVPGIPSAGCEVSFRLYKEEDSLRIQIDDDNLLQWLCTIPSLRNFLFLVTIPLWGPLWDHDGLGLANGSSSINMDLLLPCYPEIKEKFARDKRQGCCFDALELFVRDFLTEGSVFATFGIEHLYEKGTLTQLHFHDIQSQSRSISEDLDLLDDAIDKLEVQHINGLSPILMNELSRAKLRDAIERRDRIAVGKILDMDPGIVDAAELCRAIYFYEPTIFPLLLEHGAEVDGADDYFVPLYRAAEAGHMDAVRLLLSYGSDIEGGCFCDTSTALLGAASGGQLDIVRYLVEEKGTSVDGNGYYSPLSFALKRKRTSVISYLLRAGANVLNLKDLHRLKIADILSQCGPDFHLTFPPTLLTKQLRRAIGYRDVDAVKLLMNAGADVNPMDGEPPLCLAAKYGQFEIVRLLVRAGANVNPQELRRVLRSPLAEASLSRHAEVANFLVSTGANLLPGEYQLLTKNPPQDEYQVSGRRYEFGMEISKPYTKFVTVSRFLKEVKDSGWFEDEEDCLAVAAIRAQERRVMVRRLFAKVASSREKLLNAGASEDASASLEEFVDQVGTISSVFKIGTRAIRDISEGYMPSGLRDIVSALQVANAMRSALPHSKLLCSKEEFVDDIPRWASLLGLDDQRLLYEISPHLWRIPASQGSKEGAGAFACEESLMFLQELVNNLMRASGLFVNGLGSSHDSHRLQSLRQKYHSVGCETRVPLAEWCPLPTPEVQKSLHTDTSKPPDPEGNLKTLDRITVLIAGAIFGAVLLYLSLSQYGFSTLRPPILASDARIGSSMDRITARNCVILAVYIRFTSVVDSMSWKSNGTTLQNPTPPSIVMPNSPTTVWSQEHIVAGQSSYKSDCNMLEIPSIVDYTMEDGPPGYSRSLPSQTVTSPSVTALSSSTRTTTTPGSTTTSTSERGTIHCEHCKATFQLGKNGRRGRASNLRKHIKSHHPDTLPNYQRVLHECRWGCGAKDPYKSNIVAHEKRYCAKTKGKQPRRHGKWRDATTWPF